MNSVSPKTFKEMVQTIVTEIEPEKAGKPR